MTTITCRLPSELHAQLAAAARRDRVPKSVIVRRALEKIFRAKDRPVRPSAYDALKHVCGSLKGGPRDLSTNPKYLEDLGA